jgi:hypothetical protein
MLSERLKELKRLLNVLYGELNEYNQLYEDCTRRELSDKGKKTVDLITEEIERYISSLGMNEWGEFQIIHGKSIADLNKALKRIKNTLIHNYYNLNENTLILEDKASSNIHVARTMKQDFLNDWGRITNFVNSPGWNI